MLELTNNQYHEFLAKNASRLYSDPDYTLKQFNEDADNVKILDFDLSEYPQLPDDVKSIINGYFSEETLDRNGHRMFEGFTLLQNGWSNLIRALNATLNLDRGLVGLASCRKYLLIMTYTEGDLTLEVFTTEEDFEKELKASCDFYEKAA